MDSPNSADIGVSKRAAGLHARVGRRRGRLIFTIVAALGLLAGATVVTAYAVTVGPDTYSFFTSTDVSNVPVDVDNRQVELGLKFTSRSAGTLDAVRILKVKDDTATHRLTVWSDTGQAIASATAPGKAGSDWQQVALPKPVPIAAGHTYTVSYNTSTYRATQGYFTGRGAKAGPLRTVGPGVFAYGTGGFPTQTWNASNYWIDVVFTSTGGNQAPAATPPAGPATSSPTPAPEPSTTSLGPAVTSQAPAPAGQDVSLDLPRVPWEGGPAYYDKFAQAKASGFAKPDFFPTGVWFEGVLEDADVAKDKAAGLNTYVELTSNSDIGVVNRGGMRAITSWTTGKRGNESVGWLLVDEADMWGGPGGGKWTGKFPGEGDVCSTKDGCGMDALKKIGNDLPSDSRMRYANFGKGVVFWESDQEAAAFVNQTGTDILSDDVYWYTDANVCGSSSEGPSLGVTAANCRRAANYGLTMDRLRQLDAVDGKRQPIYAFVEVGHPASEASAPTITGPQIVGATMSSLIHEARGVIYFNHNFGGDCVSQHVLRDGCGAAVRPAVTELNRRIDSLAPVLNTQSYEWKASSSVDTMLKASGKSFYLFAMPGRTGGTGTQTLKLPAGLSGAKAEVLFEDRSVPISGGAITDSFDKEYSYHIYKITP